MKIDNIKKIMLGHLANDVKLVIITPLKSTYRRLKERLDVKEIYKNAFFENCIFNIKESRKGIVILSPQGIASKILLNYLKIIRLYFLD